MTLETDCAIVGGGIHGTYLANRLRAETDFDLDPEQLLLIDPHEQLLASFREKARACGMEALRSTFVHHLGTEAFGLERFAERTRREDELIATVDYPPRPSLELFLDFADELLDQSGLESVHEQAQVTGITNPDATNGLRLETTGGPIDATHCVLAIGHGGRYAVPDWARDWTDSGRITHVWDGFDSEETADRTIVVGGGITAAQLACDLTATHSVTLLSRHPLEWEVSEAAPPWINWHHIEQELHAYPPGSRERFEIIDRERNTATIPPYFYQRFSDRIADGSLTLEQGTVEAVSTGETWPVRLSLEHGKRLSADRVVLATGFEPVGGHPFVEQLTTELECVRGPRGLPVLDDTTLRWTRETGEPLPLYVTGALALGAVGPYAPNIPGARRGADRIIPAIAGADRSHRAKKIKTASD